MRTFVRAALLPVVFAISSSCARFDAPPETGIVGLTEGLLPDPHAPIVLAFSKPPAANTVKIEIARYVHDSAGRLGDEPGNTLGTGLDTFFSHDPMVGDTGGSSVLAADRSTLTITPSVPLPVGAQLVVLVEPGLADAQGTVTHVRRRVVFGYAPQLNCNAPAHIVQSGTYFLLTSVNQPVNVQIQLFGAIVIDETTGKAKTRFTKAKRNPDTTRCNPPCPAADVCRTLPGPPMCVTPSTSASTVDEYPDYVPNDDPMAGGFSFAPDGCAVDQDAKTATFATSPVDVDVTSPNVTLRNAALDTSFAVETDGTLRATGTLTADAVLLGTIATGMGMGNVTARSIPADQVPQGIPQP